MPLFDQTVTFSPAVVTGHFYLYHFSPTWDESGLNLRFAAKDRQTGRIVHSENVHVPRMDPGFGHPGTARRITLDGEFDVLMNFGVVGEDSASVGLRIEEKLTP